MHGLADVGQAHVAPEVTARHCQAGGTAVHLVDLPYVREAADPAALLLPGLTGPLVGDGLGSLLGLLHLVDLIEPDRLADGRTRGENLLGEVERHPGRELELVLLDVALDDVAEDGIALEQASEVLLL